MSTVQVYTSTKYSLPNHTSFFRSERGFKYVPLNSMTLSSRKPESSSSSNSESQANPKPNETTAENNEGRNKRPWWQSLPSGKNQKNKVILEEYDKLKSSLPKWPWMSALKEGGSGNQARKPLKRKNVKDTVRVVMTTNRNTPEEDKLKMKHHGMDDKMHSDMKNTMHSDMKNTMHSDMKDKMHSHMEDMMHSDMKDTMHSHMDDMMHSGMSDKVMHTNMKDMKHSEMSDMIHSEMNEKMHADMMEVNHDQNMIKMEPIKMSMEKDKMTTSVPMLLSGKTKSDAHKT